MSHVLDHERARREACVAGDLATLESLLSDDCIYVHSSAARETKEELLSRLRSGDLKYHAFDLLDANVREYSDIAVIDGSAQIEVATAGGRRAFQSRFLQVWQRTGHVWKMVSWQSTTIPPAA